MTYDLGTLATAAASGGGLTLVGQWVGEWFKGRRENDQVARNLDAQLEEHKGELTFKLLEAAQTTVAEMQKQVSDMLPHIQAAAHLQEALDHIYALMHSEGPEESRAAEKRASAFLRRMRPDIGTLRNQAQTHDSAQELRSRGIDISSGNI